MSKDMDKLRMRVDRAKFSGPDRYQHELLVNLIDREGRFKIATHEENGAIHIDPKLIIPVNTTETRDLLRELGMENRTNMRPPYQVVFAISSVRTILAKVGDHLKASPVELMREALELKLAQSEGYVERLLAIRTEVAAFYLRCTDAQLGTVNQ